MRSEKEILEGADSFFERVISYGDSHALIAAAIYYHAEVMRDCVEYLGFGDAATGGKGALELASSRIADELKRNSGENQ